MQDKVNSVKKNSRLESPEVSVLLLHDYEKRVTISNVWLGHINRTLAGPVSLSSPFLKLRFINNQYSGLTYY